MAAGLYAVLTIASAPSVWLVLRIAAKLGGIRWMQEILIRLAGIKGVSFSNTVRSQDELAAVCFMECP